MARLFRFVFFGFVVLQSLAAAATHQWVTRYTNGAPFVDIAAGAGKFVAVCNTDSGPKIVWSGNGVDWREAAPQDRPLYYLAAAGFGGGKFVVGGASELLMVSENGKDWTITRSPVTDNYIWDIVWFNGAYLALARTSLLRSVDGVNWERIGIPGIFYSMGIMRGELVMQGPDQGMQASADLRNWRRLRQPDLPSQLSVANDLLFYGSIMSRDGIDWHRLQFGGQQLYPRDVVAADGRTLLIASGEVFDVTSADGSALKKIDVAAAPISKLAYQDGRLFGVGSEGAIFELSSLTFLRTGQIGERLQLDVSGPVGGRVRIDSSEDMINWVEGASVLNLPVLSWEAPETPAARRFYRAILVE